MPLDRWLYRFRRLVRRVATPTAHAEALNDELRFHLEMEIEHNVRSGMSPAEARAKAHAEIGAHGEWRERSTRDALGARPGRGAAIETLLRDVRHGARALRRTPGFSLVAVVTIALGIGVTTAVYSAVDGVLLRPLPYPAPDQLVRIYERSRTGERNAVAGANAVDVQREARTLAAAAYVAAYEMTVLGANEPLRARVATVSREFFDVFRTAPARGRTFAPGEGMPNGPTTAVVSERFWRESLGADPAVQSRVLRIADQLVPVVGVMPASFTYPARVDIWVATTDVNPSRTAHNWSLVARLAPGRTVREARAEVDAILRRVKGRDGTDSNAEGASLFPLQEDLARGSRSTLLMLLGAVGLVLLVACVNIASANLARGEGRRHEYAVRTALGAGRGRIARQLVTENLLLALVGGAIGCALAWALTRALVAAGSVTLLRFTEPRLDWRVLTFAAVASIVTGLVVALAPALQIRRDLRGAISGGGRAGIDGARLRTRGVLIGAEVALAVALLAGAGLLMKSLRTLLAEDLGFRTENALTADLSLPGATFADTTRVRAFYDRLLPAVRAIPGVVAAGVTSSIPIGGNGGNSMFAADGGTELLGSTDYRVVDGAYFRTMRIPVAAGRLFEGTDVSTAPHVAIVNRAMAQKFWPGGSALGHRIRFPGMDAHPEVWLTIVGVVGDVRDESLDVPATPGAYVHAAQRPERLGGAATVVVRATALTPALGDLLRERVRAIDPNVPVRVATLRSIVDESVRPRRFTATVLTTFAALALLLAAVGIHGVLAYVVAQRRREIGVRMALGAAHGTVRAMVLRDAMRAVLPGVAIGIAAALALSRVLRGMLYGVRATDPAVLAGVAALLTAVALGAAWIPARRATHVDPIMAIKEE